MSILKIKEWLQDEEAQSLTLNEKNIESWKRLLDKTMFEKGGFKDYSKCLWDKQWLEGFLGATPYQAVMEEMENWED